MSRPIELTLTCAVFLDREEVDTPEKLDAKKREIEGIINDLDPAVGLFQVETIQ